MGRLPCSADCETKASMLAEFLSANRNLSSISALPPCNPPKLCIYALPWKNSGFFFCHAFKIR